MKECLVSALSNFVFLMAVYTVCANVLCPFICFCKKWLRVIMQSKSILNFISVTDDRYSRSLLNACAWAYRLYNQQQRMSRRPYGLKRALSVQLTCSWWQLVGQLFDHLLSLSIHLTGTASNIALQRSQIATAIALPSNSPNTETLQPCKKVNFLG